MIDFESLDPGIRDVVRILVERWLRRRERG